MRPFNEVLREEVDRHPDMLVEITRRAGVSKASMTKMLNGKRPNPGRQVMKGLADALGIPVERLFR